MENKVSRWFCIVLFMNFLTFLQGNNAVDRHHQRKISLGDLEKTKLSIETQFMPYDVSDGNFEVVKSSCVVEEKKIYPKRLNNTRDEEVRIVNSDKYKQSITIKKCLSKNDLCNKHLIHPANVLSVCKQSYVILTLKTLNHRDEVVDDQFRVPSYCSCQLVRRKKPGVEINKIVNLIDDNIVE